MFAAKLKMFSLNQAILIAALVGAVIGFSLNGSADSALKATLLYSVGLIADLFINLLKMILVPLIFTSIVVGVASLQAHRQAKKVWQYTLMFFVLTSTLAMVQALLVSNWFKPGANIEVSLFAEAMQSFSHAGFTPQQFAAQFLSELFVNPFTAFAEVRVLPIVVYALMLGVAIVMGAGRYPSVLTLMQEILDITMRMVGWIMWLAPVGIAALLIKLLAQQDLGLITTLGAFIALVFGSTLFHGVVVLPLLLYIVTRKSPLWFWRGARDSLITAFATSSSSATLPITLRCAQDNLGVRKPIAGFVIPLGATINMDGTALYEAAAALFVANLVGVELSFTQQLIVFITAMIASMGAPGIPSAGMVTMMMVLQAVGLPAEAIAILLPIDRLLDTVRTAVNVEGDMVGALIVDKLTATDSLEVNSESVKS